MRPLECEGHAYGICTGPFGSLNEYHFVQLEKYGSPANITVKEVIDFNTKHIARRLLKNPEKDTLYYSIDPNDPEGRKIGLGIFAGHVGSDVIEEITSKLYTIPAMVQHARVTGTDI